MILPPLRKITYVFALIAFISIPSFGQGSAWSFYKLNGKIMGKYATTGKEITLASDVKKTVIDNGDTTDVEDDYAIVSYVGPYLTMLHSSFSYLSGAAHPNSERTFEVINANTKKPVKLTEFYTETEIFTALTSDKIIRDALPGDSQPKDLSELIATADGGCEMKIGWNMIESFAFHHVEAGKVAIRIGLTHSCSAANGMLTQLGIFFPIPEKLKAMLAEAETKKTFMKDRNPKINRME